MGDNEIYIRTTATEVTNRNDYSQDGIQKTSKKAEDGLEKIDLEVKEDNKSKFDELLQKTNEIIHKIADNLSHSVDEVNNLTEMEIEFGIGFTQGLKLGIFETGSNQSINVKIKLQKKQ